MHMYTPTLTQTGGLVFDVFCDGPQRTELDTRLRQLQVRPWFMRTTIVNHRWISYIDAHIYIHTHTPHTQN